MNWIFPENLPLPPPSYRPELVLCVFFFLLRATASNRARQYHCILSVRRSAAVNWGNNGFNSSTFIPVFFSHPLRLSSYFVLRASSSSCSDSVCLSLSASVPSHFVSLLPLCLSLSLSYFWFLVCPPSLFNILSLSPSPGCLARLCSSRRFSRFAVDKRGLTKIRMIELLKQNYLTQTRNLLSLLYVCWDRKKDNFMHLILKITSIIIWIQTCVLSVYWIVG